MEANTAATNPMTRSIAIPKANRPPKAESKSEDWVKGVWSVWQPRKLPMTATKKAGTIQRTGLAEGFSCLLQGGGEGGELCFWESGKIAPGSSSEKLASFVQSALWFSFIIITGIVHRFPSRTADARYA